MRGRKPANPAADNQISAIRHRLLLRHQRSRRDLPAASYCEGKLTTSSSSCFLLNGLVRYFKFTAFDGGFLQSDDTIRVQRVPGIELVTRSPGFGHADPKPIGVDLQRGIIGI